MRNLFLEAGHGGTSSGCIAYDGSLEKKYTLELTTNIYEKIKPYIPNNCFILTTTDKNISLDQRSNIGNKYKPFWLSIHYNAFNKLTRGTEFFISKYCSNENKNKFKQILDGYCLKFNTKNRGIKTRLKSNNDDYYYLHRSTLNSTVCIIESLFIDNKDDFNILKSKNYLAEASTLYAKLILKHLYNIDYKEKETNTNKLYKVQIGAFKEKENAEELVKQLKSKGINSIIV